MKRVRDKEKRWRCLAGEKPCVYVTDRRVCFVAEKGVDEMREMAVSDWTALQLIRSTAVRHPMKSAHSEVVPYAARCVPSLPFYPPYLQPPALPPRSRRRPSIPFRHVSFTSLIFTNNFHPNYSFLLSGSIPFTFSPTIASLSPYSLRHHPSCRSLRRLCRPRRTRFLTVSCTTSM